jgi:hypothetical protein
MPRNATPKKRKKATVAKSDSFVYRGVRIMRTWTNSDRSEAIAEAMRKVIERGPAQIAAE